MPRKTNDSGPPKVMTWGKAMPVLVLCVIFDALRAFFSMFWFFGPALAALYCTSTTSGWVGSLGGLTTAACTAGAGALGFYGFVPAATFGTVMAMAVGLIGWLTVFLIQLINNAGIFKENFAMIIRILLGLLLSEIPIINALPSLTILNATMFHIQIKKGKEELKKWKKKTRRRKQKSGTVKTHNLCRRKLCNNKRQTMRHTIKSKPQTMKSITARKSPKKCAKRRDYLFPTAIGAVAEVDNFDKDKANSGIERKNDADFLSAHAIAPFP